MGASRGLPWWLVMVRVKFVGRPRGRSGVGVWRVQAESAELADALASRQIREYNTKRGQPLTSVLVTSVAREEYRSHLA